MGTIWQDLRYGARLLLKKPGFTIAALAMLALGIGASTTERYPGVSSYNFTHANYFDLARTPRTLHDMAYRPWQFNLSGGREPETVDGCVVTPNCFSSVGITRLLGRTFAEQDNLP